jgi:CBS domain-containing protein
MICDELMKHAVECVRPDERVESAARRMRESNVGFLPVCDAHGRLVGTITDRDIAVRYVAEALPRHTDVEQVMTRHVVTCRPEDDVRIAEQLMAEHHIARIVCSDDIGRPVGVISLSDVAQCESDERAAWTLRQITEREGPVLHYGF